MGRRCLSIYYRPISVLHSERCVSTKCAGARSPSRSMELCPLRLDRRFLCSSSPRLDEMGSPQAAPPRIGSPSMGKGNYFSFFEFPASPEVDEAVLQKRYHTLQRLFHPDQQQQQSASAQTDNADTDGRVSRYANEGYAVLKDPFLRCKYLLKLQLARNSKEGGVSLSVKEEEDLAIEQDSAIREGNVRELDEEFLMEMMAMNELIFAGDRNIEQVRNQLAVLKADLTERFEEHFDLVKEYWEEKDWESCQRALHKWTYIWNALKNLKERI